MASDHRSPRPCVRTAPCAAPLPCAPDASAAAVRPAPGSPGLPPPPPPPPRSASWALGLAGEVRVWPLESVCAGI